MVASRVHFDCFNPGKKARAVHHLECARQKAGFADQPSLQGNQNPATGRVPELARPNLACDPVCLRMLSRFGSLSVLDNDRDLGIVASLDDLDHAICPSLKVRSIKKKPDS
jgi:hypothetical protein